MYKFHMSKVSIFVYSVVRIIDLLSCLMLCVSPSNSLQELKQQNALLAESKVLVQDEVTSLLDKLERMSEPLLSLYLCVCVCV